MLSLIFGLTAACAWAVHDLMVRKLGQSTPHLPMMLVVLAAGTVTLAVPAFGWGNWDAMGPVAIGFSGLAGLAYALATGGLYRAFSLAPVRLVAPILGAYPMISLALAAFDGRHVSGVEVLAVLAIVAGIAVIAINGRNEQTVQHPVQAILWAIAGSTGFAATFWLGQEAARQGSILPAMLLTRLTALIVVAGLCLALHARLDRIRDIRWILVGMGQLDALALALVTAAATLAYPEYAAISSSVFGVLTILLAWRVLGEKVLALQWFGTAVIFAGIAVLSMHG